MRPARAVVLIATAAVLLVSACSSGDDADTSPTPTPTPSTSAPVSAPVESGVATTSAPATSSTPSSTAASTTPVASSSAPSAPAFTTTCGSLSVRVLKGGAIRGAEIAAMQFVNDGTAACTVTGTPTATLLRGGKVIGTPSQPNSDAVRPFTLQPGDVGESLLRDFSTCNAPLSDNLRLVLPTHNGKAGRTATEPITLRACTLRVAPVGAPA